MPQVPLTELTWEELRARAARGGVVRGARDGSGGGATRGTSPRTSLAAHVKEVLPNVPMADILKDLGTILCYIFIYKHTYVENKNLYK